MINFYGAKLQIKNETTRVARVKSGEITRKIPAFFCCFFPKLLEVWNNMLIFAANILNRTA